MFYGLDVQHIDLQKTKAEIEWGLKDINPSLANMLQSMLNKYEKAKDLPLTKIVEPITVIDTRTEAL